MTKAVTYPEESLDVVVADQLWSVAHEIRMIPGVYLPARMVVMRLDDKRLALHSPVPITDAMAAKIDALGTVAVIIAPNNYHHLSLPKAAARYPEAEVWAAPGLPEKRKDLTFKSLLGPAAAPAWSSTLKPLFLAGAPKMDETVFVHRGTRSLIVTDSFFNLGSHKKGLLSSTVFRLTGSWKKPGQSRIWRSIVKDRPAMLASTDAVLAEDFDRVIMAHGDVIETGGHAAFTAATRWLLPKG